MINSSLIFSDILENLGLSSISSLIGIGIVFLVLALIIGSIYLLNIILNIIEERRNQSSVPAEVKTKQTEAVEEKQPEIISEIISEEDNKKIVAVITAALMVSAFDKPNVRFIVRKIRKV